MALDDESSLCCNVTLDLSDFSDLCELMPTRLLVSGIIIQLLRQHFSNSDNFDNAFLDTAVWTDSIDTTGIVIDSVFKFNAAETERRPAIFVKPNAWQILNSAIDNRKTVHSNREGDICCPKIEIYNNLTQGSHTIFCIAGESGEVEILAREVYKELMQFGPIIRPYFNFLRFVVSEVGEIAILEEATENFVIPIVVSYGVQDIWRICPAGLTELLQAMSNIQHDLDNYYTE